jgi:hypothetical protein
LASNLCVVVVDLNSIDNTIFQLFVVKEAARKYTGKLVSPNTKGHETEIPEGADNLLTGSVRNSSNWQAKIRKHSNNSAKNDATLSKSSSSQTGCQELRRLEVGSTERNVTRQARGNVQGTQLAGHKGPGQETRDKARPDKGQDKDKRWLIKVTGLLTRQDVL